MKKLKDIYAPIAADLALLESGIKAQMSLLTGAHRSVDEIVRYFFEAPGQRLRPALVLLSARASLEDQKNRDGSSVEFPNMAATLAVLVEYIHAASLIHDDIVDNALERRSRPSLNLRFGDKIAVLAGDMLYSHAFRMLIENFDVNVMKIFSQCVQRMCRGQINELREKCDFSRYLGIIEDKTAVFMSACCEAGAEMVFNGDGDAPRRFAGFGLNLGMIYQIADDLRDADGPVPLTGASREKLAKKLNESAAAASRNLALISDSVYKESLAGLLQYIIERHREVRAAVRPL